MKIYVIKQIRHHYYDLKNHSEGTSVADTYFLPTPDSTQRVQISFMDRKRAKKYCQKYSQKEPERKLYRHRRWTTYEVEEVFTVD